MTQFKPVWRFTRFHRSVQCRLYDSYNRKETALLCWKNIFKTDDIGNYTAFMLIWEKRHLNSENNKQHQRCAISSVRQLVVVRFVLKTRLSCERWQLLRVEACSNTRLFVQSDTSSGGNSPCVKCFFVFFLCFSSKTQLHTSQDTRMCWGTGFGVTFIKYSLRDLSDILYSHPVRLDD